MSDRSYLHHKRIAAFFLMLAGLNFGWIGCGQKGPPKPPHRPLPAAVKDLSYVIHGEMVELNWTVPRTEDQKASFPVAVKVFRSRLTAQEAACENCPVRFVLSGDIPIHQKRSEKSKPLRMRHAESVEPGYRYIFKVIVLDEFGITSQDSNIIDFDL